MSKVSRERLVARTPSPLLLTPVDSSGTEEEEKRPWQKPHVEFLERLRMQCLALSNSSSCCEWT